MSTATRDAAGVLSTPFTPAGRRDPEEPAGEGGDERAAHQRRRHATEALERLYGRWARGGAGMLITGNVMIDRRSIGERGKTGPISP